MTNVTFTIEAVNAMNYRALQQAAKEIGVRATGKTDVIRNTILAAINAVNTNTTVAGNDLDDEYDAIMNDTVVETTAAVEADTKPVVTPVSAPVVSAKPAVRLANYIRVNDELVSFAALEELFALELDKFSPLHELRNAFEKEYRDLSRARHGLEDIDATLANEAASDFIAIIEGNVVLENKFDADMNRIGTVETIINNDDDTIVAGNTNTNAVTNDEDIDEDVFDDEEAVVVNTNGADADLVEDAIEIEVAANNTPVVENNSVPAGASAASAAASNASRTTSATNKLFTFVNRNELFVEFLQKDVKVIAGWSITDGRFYMKTGTAAPVLISAQTMIDKFKPFSNRKHGDIAAIVKALVSLRNKPTALAGSKAGKDNTTRNTNSNKRTNNNSNNSNQTTARRSGTVDPKWLAAFREAFTKATGTNPTGLEIKAAWDQRSA